MCSGFVKGDHVTELTEPEEIMVLKVVQLTSNSHHDNILSSLHQLRLHGLLSDVTIEVEHQGDVLEFNAHRAVLAASSGYFKELFLSQHVAQDKIHLLNMHPSDFSTFLEFVYTGKLEVPKDKIRDIQAVARFLDCEDLAKVCDEAMGAGILHELQKETAASEDTESKTKENRLLKGLPVKQHLTPQGCQEDVLSKRSKLKTKVVDKKPQGRKMRLRPPGRKVLQRSCARKETLNNDNGGRSNDAAVSEEMTEAPALSETKEGRGNASPSGNSATEVDELESDNDEQGKELEDVEACPSGEKGGDGEVGVKEEGHSEQIMKKLSKAQFKCEKCQRAFHYEGSYMKHISTHHGVKADIVFRCETCMQSFANRNNLKIHEKHVHSNERLFSCNSCTKTFKRKKDVVRHERQVHERNLQHECRVCGKTLSSKSALLLHERTHTGEKPYGCPDCSARFTQNSALKTHRRTHTGERPFPCDECDARFTQKHMLIYHKRLHSGEKPFMCEACGKSFASKEYLGHHSNIHTGSKPYKCKQCGRGFSLRNSLNQHLKTHTGERPYSCKDCDKHFTQLNALQRHQRIHTGEKPYMCGLCKRTFTDKSTLRRHTIIHDSDTPWKSYLVVLEGNVEEKKSKYPAMERADDAGAALEISDASKQSQTNPDEAAGFREEPAVPVTLQSEWTSHGAIALVSHGTLGGITVIHTEAPPAQLQPIVSSDSTVPSVIALDGSAIPISIPVSIAHPVALSSDPTSTSSPVSTLLVPHGLMTSVTEIQTVSTSSPIDETPPVSKSEVTSISTIADLNIQTVIV